MGSFGKDEIDVNDLTRLMSGGAELEALEHELRDSGATS
jgi:simple sugar transport system ATP-binding protein